MKMKIDNIKDEKEIETLSDVLFSPSDFQILIDEEELSEIDTLMRNHELSPEELPQDLKEEIKRLNGYL